MAKIEPDGWYVKLSEVCSGGCISLKYAIITDDAIIIYALESDRTSLKIIFDHEEFEEAYKALQQYKSSVVEQPVKSCEWCPSQDRLALYDVAGSSYRLCKACWYKHSGRDGR